MKVKLNILCLLFLIFSCQSKKYSFDEFTNSSLNCTTSNVNLYYSNYSLDNIENEYSIVKRRLIANNTFIDSTIEKNKVVKIDTFKVSNDNWYRMFEGSYYPYFSIISFNKKTGITSCYKQDSIQYCEVYAPDTLIKINKRNQYQFYIYNGDSHYVLGKLTFLPDLGIAEIKGDAGRIQLNKIVFL